MFREAVDQFFVVLVENRIKLVQEFRAEYRGDNAPVLPPFVYWKKSARLEVVWLFFFFHFALTL